MKTLITRTCVGCGNTLDIVLGARTDVTCQYCGCTEGILSGEGFYRFECLLDGMPFVVKGEEPIQLVHDIPHCKSTKLKFMGDTDSKDMALTSPKGVMDNVILFIRNRGLGDVLMTTAVFSSIKNKYPDHSFWYVCDGDVLEILKNNPYIDRIMVSGQDKQIQHAGKRFNLIERLENYKEDKGINQKNRIQRIFQLCDFKSPKIARPEIYLTDEEIAWAKEKVGTCDNLVGLGLESVAPFRNWRFDKYKELALRLTEEGYHVILFGQNRKDFFGKNIINTTGQLTIRELCALVNECDKIVCGDTSLYHIAEALNVKSYVLFGSIPPESRIGTYLHATGFYKEDLECTPCWDTQFAKHKDTRVCRQHEAECMSKISVEEVFTKVAEETFVAYMEVKNEEYFLEMAIKSIIPHIDGLYIQDESSTDGTLAIIKKYAKKYPDKIKYSVVDTEEPERFGENYNEVKWRNLALQKAIKEFKPTWIMKFDADELVTPFLFKEIQKINLSKFNSINVSETRFIDPEHIANHNLFIPPNFFSREIDGIRYVAPHVCFWRVSRGIEYKENPDYENGLHPLFNDDSLLEPRAWIPGITHIHLHRTFGPKAKEYWASGGDKFKNTKKFNAKKQAPKFWKDDLNMGMAKKVNYKLPKDVMDKWEEWGIPE